MSLILTTDLDFTSLVTPLPEQLPDQIAPLKQLLIAQQESYLQSVRQLLQTQSEMLERTLKETTEEVTKQITEKVTKEVSLRYEQRILDLFEQVRLARQRLYGKSSEVHAGQGVLPLFNEAETLVIEAEAPEQDLAVLPAPSQKPASTKARGKRKPLSVELPRVDVIHEIPVAERTCACGTPMVEIGESVTEQLDIIPMQVRVLRHIRKTYACPNKDRSPIIAPAPLSVLPKTNASNDFLALLLTSKYVDGLPLARFEHVLARSRAEVPRQTLARWCIHTSQAMQPLFNLAQDHLLSSGIIHMDETEVQVLKEKGRAPTSKSYMWVRLGHADHKPVILFTYDPSRSKAVPQTLLEGWDGGYLMTDGYKGYIAIGKSPHVVHQSCWVHARRKFVEAQQAMPNQKLGHASQALAFISQLYKIERNMKEVRDIGQRTQIRQSESVPILIQMRSWLDQTRPLIPPTGRLGVALSYLNEFWPRLIRYTERGDLELDNNRIENAIRPFVIGRRAWLFSDTPAGAKASALIYSMVETAKANKLDPYFWLRKVLRELPSADTVEKLEALLPWNIHAQDLITS